MNREIKFRAWDKKRETMEEFGLFESDEGYLVTGGISLVSMPIMQFTGLNDKNGIEIFEDDIIQNNSGKIYIQGLCTAKKILKEPTSTTTDFLWEEVIGNIYENPNLLLK